MHVNYCTEINKELFDCSFEITQNKSCIKAVSVRERDKKQIHELKSIQNEYITIFKWLIVVLHFLFYDWTVEKPSIVIKIRNLTVFII